MMLEDGLLGAEFANPMAPRKPHFEPKAKACIFIFMAGAPSHLDLFDPKPVLNQRAGRKFSASVVPGYCSSCSGAKLLRRSGLSGASALVAGRRSLPSAPVTE